MKPTLSAELHLRAMELNAKKSVGHWFDFEDVVDESARQVSLRNQIVELAVEGGFVQSMPGAGLNLRQNLKQFANSLREDIAEILPAGLKNLWLDSVIGILPLGAVNGCVLKHLPEHVLDKHLIVLNYGLTFGCQAIADGLTLEILQGELEGYRADGSAAFRNATDFFFSPNVQNLERLLAPRGFPDEVEAEFAIHSGALCSIMLKFVALHELGHIVNGDCDNENGVVQLSMTQIEEGSVQYVRPESAADENWLAEFAADRFALEHLCDWTNNAPTCWPNVAQIYLFFSWLEYCEQVKGALLCEYHPPASQRKRQLLQLAHQLAKSEPSDDFFSQIDTLILRWSSVA